MIIELRAKERIKDTFGKYMDPRIVSGLIATSGEHADTAERRIITVFFSDIKSFSSLSEQLTASAMVNLLNAYFTAVTQAIRGHRGIIDKYIGDGVMAFWTPPFSPGDQHATDACLAALLQQEAIDAFRRELPQLLGLRRHVPDFKVRMGLATGEVVIGTIGSETARSYTVIGDIVNTASRLEGINKMYGTGIVVAEDTYRLAQQAVEVRELDFVTVVGKTEPVRILSSWVGPVRLYQTRSHSATCSLMAWRPIASVTGIALRRSSRSVSSSPRRMDRLNCSSSGSPSSELIPLRPTGRASGMLQRSSMP